MRSHTVVYQVESCYIESVFTLGGELHLIFEHPNVLVPTNDTKSKTQSQSGEVYSGHFYSN